MTLSIPRFARSLSRHSRRAFAALLITGSLIHGIGGVYATPSFAEEIPISDLSVSDKAREAAADALDYWIFSDDYCGWASVEALVAPYSIDPLAVEPARPALSLASNRNESAIEAAANIVDQTLANRRDRDRLADDLDAIAAKEPVDVTIIDELAAVDVATVDAYANDSSSDEAQAESSTAINVEAIKESAAESNEVVEDKPATQFIGSSPVIVSISEGYVPYDMSRADQIALRMYPITIPQFGGSRPASLPGPLDCLGHGVVWSQSVLPSQSVSTVPRSDAAADRFLSSLKIDYDLIFDRLTDATNQATRDSEAKRNELVLAIVEAVQPSSQVRSYVDPVRLGNEAGHGFLTVYETAEDGLRDAKQGLASSLKPAPERSKIEVLEQTAGEKLLVRAGVEANSLNCATAGVAEGATESVCCPVERVEIAADLPATHELAVVGVATATLNEPQEPQVARESVARAEAIATACDSAAATLERFASALRRAGDSVVRVARASADSGTELR